MNKGLRKFLALALTGIMVFGGTMTAFADQESTGQGSYEGGELQYPVLSVELPAIPEDTYDYIADPNGLIEATSGEKYGDSVTFAETANGIFFLTAENTYSEKSAALTATNENAQDVDFTVKLEQVTAGDEGITYSETSTFETSDTANKIYLAVTDDTNTAALTDTAAAVLTTTVTGVPSNFEATYTDGEYGYTEKADAAGWQSYSFYMTGALNTNATWGDEVIFPEIKVTWSYAEHVDQAAPSVTSSEITLVRGANASVSLNLGAGDLAATGITKITYLNSTGASKELATTNYKVEGNTLTIYSTYTDALTADRALTIVFNDTAATQKTVTLKVATTE